VQITTTGVNGGYLGDYNYTKVALVLERCLSAISSIMALCIFSVKFGIFGLLELFHFKLIVYGY
jgi:hypothetical protein